MPGNQKSSPWPTGGCSVICVNCGVKFGEHYSPNSHLQWVCPIPNPPHGYRTPRNAAENIGYFLDPKDVNEATNNVAIIQPDNVTQSPINDHVCGHFGNNRVSKRERSCWLCGEKL